MRQFHLANGPGTGSPVLEADALNLYLVVESDTKECITDVACFRGSRFPTNIPFPRLMAKSRRNSEDGYTFERRTRHVSDEGKHPSRVVGVGCQTPGTWHLRPAMNFDKIVKLACKPKSAAPKTKVYVIFTLFTLPRADCVSSIWTLSLRQPTVRMGSSRKSVELLHQSSRKRMLSYVLISSVPRCSLRVVRLNSPSRSSLRH